MWNCKGGMFRCGAGRKNVVPIIPAGEFRNLVTIETPQIIIPDGGGGGEYGWSEVIKVWAFIQTYNAGMRGNRTQFEEAQMRERRVWLITIRYPAVKLTTAMRLLFSTHVLEIDSIVNVNELNWETQLYCTEDGDF